MAFSKKKVDRLARGRARRTLDAARREASSARRARGILVVGSTGAPGYEKERKENDEVVAVVEVSLFFFFFSFSASSSPPPENKMIILLTMCREHTLRPAQSGRGRSQEARSSWRASLSN